MSAFEELGVLPEIIRAIEELEWTLPTPIQTEAIPLILGGGDVLAAAETGSGKTGAFALPMIQVVWEELRDMARGASRSASDVDWGLNPSDCDKFMQVLSVSQAACHAGATWAGARATAGVLKGKHYFEATVTSLGEAGVVRVGWSTAGARLDLGTDAYGFGFGGTGRKSNNRRFDPYGEPYGLGDTVGCYVDCDAGIVGFTKNGGDLGAAFTGVPQNVLRQGLYPTVCLKNAEVQISFGGRSSTLALRFAPPGGYTVVGTAASDQTTIFGQAADPCAKGRAPVCLIVEPSWELAEQTHKSMQAFAKYLGSPRLSMSLLVGGQTVQNQAYELSQGVDIVTGTPGRLEAFVNEGQLSLANIRFFVLDEADNLVANNLKLLQNFYSRLPKQRLQVLMFSATLHSEEIKQVASVMCRFPTWVDLKGKDAVPTTVDHAWVSVDLSDPLVKGPFTHEITTDGVHVGIGTDADRLSESVKRLKAQILVKIIDAYQMSQCIIFCRTKVDCDNLERFFIQIGGGRRGTGEFAGSEPYSCTVVHSDRTSEERRSNLLHFKSGDVRFLITTDVGARGIDISEIPFVINYTLPDKPEDYIHRVGRVGRADRMGLAISLVASCQERVWYHTCPSKGRSCSNRALKEKGGCTIWWDEPSFWKAIVERLGGEAIPQLDRTTFKLSAAATAAVEGTALAAATSTDAPMTQYGQRRGEKPVETHASEIKDKVAELAQLEDRVQLNFWRARVPPSQSFPVRAAVGVKPSVAPKVAHQLQQPQLQQPQQQQQTHTSVKYKIQLRRPAQ
eukprot:TRINITY_DN1479_c0_g2_i2.p1 TRINITY_DN1479_c0_g2~~TRINITY_DN1479_c0_g2_i2.p1  ORF type:complete len:790 (-),score=178.01 TRINITY_DN1479_c0_g2_i2:120-2489(-)